MAELPQDPSNRELLERLTRLETENAVMMARIVELETRATNTHNALIRLIQQVGGVLGDVGLIDMQVLELMAKVFPDYIRTQGQITKILTGQRGESQPE